MRRDVTSRLSWVFGLCLLMGLSASAAVPETTDPEVAFQQALELERQRNWSGAIEAYESALEHWPGRAEFRHRLRLCESHYKLARRYQDRSFRDVLLKLPRDRAFELYDELIERIETHYVEPVALEPLVRRGLDNLEVALRDPSFLRTNHLEAASPEKVRWYRDALRSRRDALLVRDRAEAKGVVLAACDLGQRGLGLSPAAVILEFTFGACDALDDYSGYLTPDKLDDLFAMIDGNFVGLGVELKLDAQGLRLVGVIPGGPAAQAGLKVGDRITHVGGVAIQGMGLDEAAGRLQGAEGTSIQVGVGRADGTTLSLNLVRRPVEVKSVTQARIVDPSAGIGFVQLSGFQKSSTDELRRAIAVLEKQGMRHLILDLRGNPGGLLTVAVDIADGFLDQGVIVSTRGRAPGQSFVYRAKSSPAWRMPLTVLIDHDSASASEILAGALKDHRRAVIVSSDRSSYGKGSVQSIYPLRAAPAGLKLTTAKFYSPLNRPYAEQGVEPDVLVRDAAKPSASEPPAEFGDPKTDAVLSQAMRLARKGDSTKG